MLLLHQCNMDRHAWDGLAEELAGNGFNVLTFDYRGSAKAEAANPPIRIHALRSGRSGPAMWMRPLHTSPSRRAYQTRIAVGGASCGVTQSSDLAARHHDIRALLLLSGMASDAAKAYLASNASLPVFGAASEGDTGAAKGIQEAVAASKDPKSMVKIYAGTEHGVPMFAKNPDLEPMIVEWLKAQLPAQRGTH
jgi:alpha-beta hydrolase superfamily lysophospholipase